MNPYRCDREKTLRIAAASTAAILCEPARKPRTPARIRRLTGRRKAL
jgi:hypothetical protein